MHLANFGLISLDGTVRKPEPGADFTGYQNTLTSYQCTQEIAKRLGGSPPALEQRLRELADSIRTTLASS